MYKGKKYMIYNINELWRHMCTCTRVVPHAYNSARRRDSVMGQVNYSFQ